MIGALLAGFIKNNKSKRKKITRVMENPRERRNETQNKDARINKSL